MPTDLRWDFVPAAKNPFVRNVWRLTGDCRYARNAKKRNQWKSEKPSLGYEFQRWSLRGRARSPQGAGWFAQKLSLRARLLARGFVRSSCTPSVLENGERNCLGRITALSKASFGSPPLSRFSTTWGICFSLKGNPSRLNERGFVTVLPRWCTSQVGSP